jgi:hypothetical protein
MRLLAQGDCTLGSTWNGLPRETQQRAGVPNIPLTIWNLEYSVPTLSSWNHSPGTGVPPEKWGEVAIWKGGRLHQRTARDYKSYQ